MRVGQGIGGGGGSVKGEAFLGEVDGAVALLAVVIKETGELGKELGRGSGQATRAHYGEGLPRQGLFGLGPWWLWWWWWGWGGGAVPSN